MSLSLLASYASDSSAEDSDDDNDGKKLPAETKEPISLISADVMLQEAIHGKSASIFSNPYKDQQASEQSCLQKHVQLSSPKITSGEKKTQICWKFRKGRCSRGKNCPYRHDDEVFKLPEASSVADLPIETNEDDGNVVQQKRKKSGLAQGLVPPKKFMKVYNQTKQGPT